MVDVSQKPKTTRTAIAMCTIEMNSKSYYSILNNKLRKTQDKMSLLTIAEVAGMMGAKQTQNIIPMCHQIPLDFVKFKFIFEEEKVSKV